MLSLSPQLCADNQALVKNQTAEGDNALRRFFSAMSTETNY